MGCTTHNCNNRLDFTPRSPAQCRRFGLVKCNNFYHTHKSDFLQRFVAQLQRLSPALAKVDHRESRNRNRDRERDRTGAGRIAARCECHKYFPRKCNRFFCVLRVFHESKGNARDAAWSTSFSLIRKAEEADQDDDRVDSANQFENRISALASLLKQSRNKAAERGEEEGEGEEVTAAHWVWKTSFSQR